MAVEVEFICGVRCRDSLVKAWRAVDLSQHGSLSTVLWYLFWFRVLSRAYADA